MGWAFVDLDLNKDRCSFHILLPFLTNIDIFFAVSGDLSWLPGFLIGQQGSRDFVSRMGHVDINQLKDLNSF
jgi:hypothetical protein